MKKLDYVEYKIYYNDGTVKGVGNYISELLHNRNNIIKIEELRNYINGNFEMVEVKL